MKKINFLGILLISFIGFISCSDDNQQNYNQNEIIKEQNSTQAARSEIEWRYTESETIRFKKLLNDYNLFNLTNQWFESVQTSDIENTIVLSGKIKTNYKDLKQKWNEEYEIHWTDEKIDDLLIFIGEIEGKEPSGSHDGNPCTKNSDGSNYFGTCTFLGKAVVAIRAISCQSLSDTSTNPFMTYEDKKNMQSAYNSCIQNIVCKVC